MSSSAFAPRALLLFHCSVSISTTFTADDALLFFPTQRQTAGKRGRYLLSSSSSLSLCASECSGEWYGDLSWCAHMYVNKPLERSWLTEQWTLQRLLQNTSAVGHVSRCITNLASHLDRMRWSEANPAHEEHVEPSGVINGNMKYEDRPNEKTDRQNHESCRCTDSFSPSRSSSKSSTKNSRSGGLRGCFSVFTSCWILADTRLLTGTPVAKTTHTGWEQMMFMSINHFLFNAWALK